MAPPGPGGSGLYSGIGDRLTGQRKAQNCRRSRDGNPPHRLETETPARGRWFYVALSAVAVEVLHAASIRGEGRHAVTACLKYGRTPVFSRRHSSDVRRCHSECRRSSRVRSRPAVPVSARASPRRVAPGRAPAGHSCHLASPLEPIVVRPGEVRLPTQRQGSRTGRAPAPVR